ncbi:MAG: glycoside hydrolase family 11 protein [Lachnospiraceae bacterium]|nr:glycoside hydrolase family 11 protein [Lachnospiraceae bacterium]
MRKFRKVTTLTVALIFCLSFSINALAVNHIQDWTSDRGNGQANGKSSGSGSISSSGNQGTTSGTYNFSNGNVNISVTWNTSPANSGFNNLQGGGWRTGTSSRVINYNVGSYNFTSGSNGCAYLCGYGWTTSPLIEYYMVERWTNFSNNNGTSLGSFTSNNATYNAFVENTSGPNIQGSGSFKKLKSVRSSQISVPSGNQRINVQDHANFWNSKGHPLGSHNYQVFIAEGYNSSGSANFTVW